MTIRTQADLESDIRVNKLKSLISEAISEVKDLTFGEIFTALSLTIASWAKYQRSEEKNE